jgi:hypothetical protein
LFAIFGRRSVSQNQAAHNGGEENFDIFHNDFSWTVFYAETV